MVGSRSRFAAACFIVLAVLPFILQTGCGRSSPPAAAVAITADLQDITADYNRATNLLGVGEWSKPVTDQTGYTLRGRLLVFNPPVYLNGGAPYHGSPPVYVELQNLTRGAARPVGVYVAADDGFEGKLLDSRGNPPTNMLVFAYSGVLRAATQCWVILPEGASARASLDDDRPGGLDSYHGYMRSSVIPPGKAFFLSGNFSPPTNHPVPPEVHLWRGKLNLPPVKISGDQL